MNMFFLFQSLFFPLTISLFLFFYYSVHVSMWSFLVWNLFCFFNSHNLHVLSLLCPSCWFWNSFVFYFLTGLLFIFIFLNINISLLSFCGSHYTKTYSKTIYLQILCQSSDVFLNFVVKVTVFNMNMLAFILMLAYILKIGKSLINWCMLIWGFFLLINTDH